ncbi:zinc finger protein GAI-ASSOCIATED FACTOR 1-like [Malania oleifera]|uniref:zinc finger protein GAI-ASSOCIATED FACTOR 1-like n=1 Tax=Malania oleifera TaxID=397392 RepID=UPI0025AE097B|nr:zinc finger protein GAI-ASSOCIATED FACTOR 1-like [Malania oleifera]
MSNISGDAGSLSSGTTTGPVDEVQQKINLHHHHHHLHLQYGFNGSSTTEPPPATNKKKRSQPGTPDPNAEVIALSPKTLMATNRFVCEICNKGFQRDQNLQLHRRGHNLPWKLRQRSSTDIRKRVYVCPEPSCVHHNPARALGDLTGIKKHFCRKHGEKKWKCEKCSKKYAVQSDWKAHAKTCGTREYKCDCGTIFSRRDSFITHRAFCDALAEENHKMKQGIIMANMGPNPQCQPSSGLMPLPPSMPSSSNINANVPAGMQWPAACSLGFSHPVVDTKIPLGSLSHGLMSLPPKTLNPAGHGGLFSCHSGTLFGAPRSNTGSGSPHMSATALLQKAAQMGATANSGMGSVPFMQKGNFVTGMAPSTFNPCSLYDQSQLLPLAGGDTMAGMFPIVTFNDIIQNNDLLMKDPKHDHILDGDNSTTMVSNPQPGLIGGAAANESVGVGNRTTVDFLGIGGMRARANLNHEQKQEIGFEGEVGEWRNGKSAMEMKPMWEV